MRQRVTYSRLEQFMEALGASANSFARVYLVGGASSVLLGWREATIDVDLKFVPDSDELLRTLPALKERLHMNIELASPDDFIPELPGWEERSTYIRREGNLTFLHYDFHAQALAKIERGHMLDQQDVREMIKRGLVAPDRLLELFRSIEAELYRYPAIDASTFRRAVELVVNDAKSAPPERS